MQLTEFGRGKTAGFELLLFIAPLPLTRI